MDQSTLISVGHAFIEALDAAALAPQIAMWIRGPDIDRWKLWIVSPHGKTDEQMFYRTTAAIILGNLQKFGALSQATLNWCPTHILGCRALAEPSVSKAWAMSVFPAVAMTDSTFPMELSCGQLSTDGQHLGGDDFHGLAVRWRSRPKATNCRPRQFESRFTGKHNRAALGAADRRQTLFRMGPPSLCLSSLSIAALATG